LAAPAYYAPFRNSSGNTADFKIAAAHIKDNPTKFVSDLDLGLNSAEMSSTVVKHEQNALGHDFWGTFF